MDIDRALDDAEAALAAGRGLDGTGFWKAVGAVRKRSDLAQRYADRIGAIDRRAFEAGARLRVPAWAGTTALSAASAAGIAAVALSRSLDAMAATIVFLAGFGAVDVATHSLAHWVVGRVTGMKFSHYFIGGPPPPRPGAKLDYATYLRVPPRRRAVMHASGAVVTKVVPFALLAFAPSRAIAALLALIGLGQIATDVLFSTRSSDWKKVRREWRAGRVGPSASASR